MTIDDLVKVYERHGIKASVPDLIEVVRALAGEVESPKLSNDLFQGSQKLEAEMNTQLTIQLQTVRAERDRLKAALVKFLAEADNAPKRIIGSGIGGQTMEATLQRSGRLVSEWQLGQLEEALGDAS